MKKSLTDLQSHRSRMSSNPWNKRFWELFNKTTDAIWEHQNLTNAQQFALESLEIALKYEWHRELSGSYNHLGIIAEHNLQLDEALEYHKKTVASGIQAKHPKSIISGYCGMVHIFSSKARLAEAEEYARKALSIAIDHNIGESIAVCRENLAAVLLERGVIEEAIELILLSNEYARKYGPEGLVVYNLDKLSGIFLERKDYETSLAYAKESYEYAKSINKDKELAIANEGLCKVHLKLGNYQEAVDREEEAVRLFKKAGFETFRVEALIPLAEAYAKLQNFEKSSALLNESILHLRAKDKFSLVDALILQGDIFLQIGDISSALPILEEAYSKLLHLKSSLQKHSIHALLAEAYERSNDLVNAIIHLKLYHEAVRGLFDIESDQRMEALKIQMSLERNERETELQRLRSERLEKELGFKQEELQFNALHLATQTELLGKFRNKLRQIVREIDEPIAALKKIKEELKTLPCESVDWRKFEEQFISVHPEFRAKLIEKYPDLTKQEVKMCQLARLGLKNIEMAQLLCLSERSVESHRYNLRKKLGLKTEENLMKFLGEMRYLSPGVPDE